MQQAFLPVTSVNIIRQLPTLRSHSCDVSISICGERKYPTHLGLWSTTSNDNFLHTRQQTKDKFPVNGGEILRMKTSFILIRHRQINCIYMQVLPLEKVLLYYLINDILSKKLREQIFLIRTKEYKLSCVCMKYYYAHSTRDFTNRIELRVC